MLQGQYRLKKNRDFKKVFSHGKAIPSKFIVVYFRRNESERLRIGFSVSKKLGGAVVRNRIKRVLREVVRKHVTEIVPGLDLVFIARNSIRGKKSTEVEVFLMKLLDKHKLLRR